MSTGSAAPWVDQLLAEGYCIIPDLLPGETIAALEADLDPVFSATPMGQGHFYGYRTKRFGGLLRRSAHAQALVMAPTILALVDAVLGAACNRIQLNVAQAIEIHPGEPSQFPHRDHDMWAGTKGEHEYLVNVMWPLTPFTADNGATRLYPFSHGAKGMAKDDPGEPVVAQCLPGSAIYFLGSTAHGAGANISRQPRRGVVVGYSLGWLKPYENLWLSYPPEIARHFSPDLAALAGYAQHRPNLGNYEGQCPSILLRDDVPDHIGAIDALRPDQADMLAHFARAAGRRPMSPSLVFEPTYTAIKTRLMQGLWPSGFRLDTARLSADLGVSKSPVRDSLNRLVGERMIVSGVGEGFHVPRYDDRQLRDLFGLNLLLMLAATPDDTQLAALPAAGPHTVQDDRDAAGLFRHVAAHSGNQELVSCVSSLNDRLAVVRRLDPLALPDPFIDLDALVQAIGSGAPAWATRDILRRYHMVRISHACDYARLLDRTAGAAE